MPLDGFVGGVEVVSVERLGQELSTGTSHNEKDNNGPARLAMRSSRADRLSSTPHSHGDLGFAPQP